METYRKIQLAHIAEINLRTDVLNNATAVHPFTDVDVILMFVPTAVDDDDTGFEQFTCVWIPLVCTVIVPFRNRFAGNC